MKKIYFAPEMEIVNIKNQQLLAGSTNAPVDDDNTQDNGDALAPGVQEVLELFDE